MPIRAAASRSAPASTEASSWRPSHAIRSASAKRLRAPNAGVPQRHQVSFALWDVRKTGSGKNVTTTQLLLFSSNWDGNQIVLQRLAGGNLFVHAR